MTYCFNRPTAKLGGAWDFKCATTLMYTYVTFIITLKLLNHEIAISTIAEIMYSSLPKWQGGSTRFIYSLLLQDPLA